MAANSIVYAGTVGQGVWRSADGGETFRRSGAGMFIEADVRALAAHPHDPQVLYAGTNAGIYRTENGGERWERLPAPFDPGHGWEAGTSVWSLLVHPRKPDTLFAGTCPSALYRSQDAGATWEPLEADLVRESPALVYMRVTCLVSDPADDATVWAGIELDGARCSTDGGTTWQRRDRGLSSPDIHDLAVIAGSPSTLVAATNNDVNISRDGGATWQPQNVKERFPWAYCRALTPKAGDERTLFLGNGNGPPGTAGAVQISRDGGMSWQAAEMSPAPNSTVWTFATNRADPDLVFCASVLGYLYRSEDGGVTWRKCRHEFGEVRALAWSAA